jgi:hypothetical protein
MRDHWLDFGSNWDWVLPVSGDTICGSGNAFRQPVEIRISVASLVPRAGST